MVSMKSFLNRYCLYKILARCSSLSVLVTYYSPNTIYPITPQVTGIKIGQTLKEHYKQPF